MIDKDGWLIAMGRTVRKNQQIFSFDPGISGCDADAKRVLHKRRKEKFVKYERALYEELK